MAESTHRAKALFLAALDLTSPAERAAYLARECGADAALHRRVEAMLAAHAAPDSFLEKPAAQLGQTIDAPVVLDAEQPDGPGTRIGPYKLLEQIGEGGMGVVYAAEQLEPVRRLVALKIIKPGLDSRTVLARFEAERQALALMDHPNIAKVHDAGTTADGRPYFVMELVKGTPITAFCDARKLTTPQRLELFIAVCQAIQHAHQKGVIHRDIKPSNVLVALYDDKPVPKVIDFGIAKAAGQVLTDKTLHTSFGAVIGTPEYMSPEQATFNQLDIDTRSDVYSLGVLLYELLTGTTPLDRNRFQEAALLEVLRVVREEEPPRPSAKLSTSAARATIAATRGTEAGKLAQLLRGELDWIAMKALEKDRQRRYDTPAGLARDVERYLKDETIEARPPSAAYRLRKLIKRHRGTVAVVSLLLLTLLGGIIGTTWGMLESQQERDDAVRARHEEAAALARAEQARREEMSARLLAERNEQRAQTAQHALQMQVALRAWEQHDIVEAERVLDAVALAGNFHTTWEWRHLRDLCQRKALPLRGHDKRINSVAWSADGKHLASASDDQTVKVWDTHTGQVKQTLQGHRDRVNCVALSGDGQRLVSGSKDQTIKVWDAGTGKILHDLAGHKGEVLSVAFSGDGQRLVSSCAGGIVKVWDTRTGKQTFSCQDSQRPIHGVALSADGQRMLSGTETLLLRDAATGEVKRTIALRKDDLAFCLALSPDGQRIGAAVGAGFFNPFVHVWDAATGRELFVLRGHTEPVVSVAYSADGRSLVTGSEDNTAKVWDARTGQEKHTLQGHWAGPITAAFSGDGQRVVTGGGDGMLRLWQPAVTQARRTIRENRQLVNSVAISADNQRLVAGYESTLVRYGTPVPARSCTFSRATRVSSAVWPSAAMGGTSCREVRIRP